MKLGTGFSDSQSVNAMRFWARCAIPLKGVNRIRKLSGLVIREGRKESRMERNHLLKSLQDSQTTKSIQRPVCELQTLASCHSTVSGYVTGSET